MELFKKKKCYFCGKKIRKSWKWCPYCGSRQGNKEDEEGLLFSRELERLSESELGFQDKIGIKMINLLMKELGKQMTRLNKELDWPGGFNITISSEDFPKQEIKKQKTRTSKKKILAEDKIVEESDEKRFYGLEEEEAKADVRRLSDKIVYEISMPGVKKEEDILIIESNLGVEIRGISDKKVLVKSIPLNNQIKKTYFKNNILKIEFAI